MSESYAEDDPPAWRPTYPLATNAARNLPILRKRRRWSASKLAAAVAAYAGTPLIPRSVIANLETGRRDTVTVDEAYALAAVFGITVDQLVADELHPECSRCGDMPPDGFSCLVCSRSTPAPAPAEPAEEADRG